MYVYIMNKNALTLKGRKRRKKKWWRWRKDIVGEQRKVMTRLQAKVERWDRRISVEMEWDREGGRVAKAPGHTENEDLWARRIRRRRQQGVRGLSRYRMNITAFAYCRSSSPSTLASTISILTSPLLFLSHLLFHSPSPPLPPAPIPNLTHYSRS